MCGFCGILGPGGGPDEKISQNIDRHHFGKNIHPEGFQGQRIHTGFHVLAHRISRKLLFDPEAVLQRRYFCTVDEDLPQSGPFHHRLHGLHGGRIQPGLDVEMIAGFEP